MKEQTLKKLELDIDEQSVMPLNRDLQNCRKFKIPAIFKGSNAIFVKKMAFPNRGNWTNNWEDDKSVIQKNCKDFPNFNFLVNFQYRKGVTFNSDEMEYFERVQQIPELNQICMNEKNPRQTLSEFSNQLDGWISRNSGKEIVPTLDPSTEDMARKAFLIKDKGLQKCAVIFRGYRGSKDRVELSRILATLRSLGIYSFVFGTFPKKHNKNEASMLYAPLYHKANAVSSWIAWSGRATEMTLLCSNWSFNLVKDSDDGLSDYDGNTRKDFIKTTNSAGFNTALGQIDTINQANELTRRLSPLTKVQFEKLFS